MSNASDRDPPSAAAAPVGSVDTALRHTARLLATDPALAAEQASEVLRVQPRHPLAFAYLGAARRALGDSAGAIEALRRAVALQPGFVDAWRTLGDLLFESGDAAGADAAYARQIQAATRDPRLLAPAAALCANDVPRAEALLRAHLKQFPTDVAAIRMLAEVAARLRRYRDSATLLERCLELNPSFDEARQQYALVLHRQNDDAAALRQIDALLAKDPHNPSYRNLQAAILVRLGDVAQSIEIYDELLARHPQLPKIWMSYGHALKTGGREADSAAAYRRSVALRPELGEAYWSLANLKTVRFAPTEIATMRAQLARTDLADEDRYHLHFALGKALEDAGEYPESFAQYAAANRVRRAGIRYSAEELSEHVRRSKRLFSPAFFAARRGFGCPAPDPIFVVGLPRSGSTLIEQILSSHSAVEGTMELPDIPALARPFYGQRGGAPGYPDALAGLDAAACRALGERYLEQTRIQRRRGAPYFVDKMPNNFVHLGLIHLALPNAKIIDARRHPLGCCFSCFKQHFARGQLFTYDLDDLGRYYHDYVELMAHFDAVLPGRVHRVHYERMIEDTEGEVRRLFDYLGLPFEPATLRFYETERAVRTASAQQVRQPIYREGLEQWRRYEPWLEPLEAALGPVLAAYPGTPAF